MASGNSSRQISMTLPDGSVEVEMDYGSSGVNDAISRLEAINFPDLSTGSKEAAYEYIGMQMIATATYGPDSAPLVRLDRSIESDATATQGTYDGYDRFGRIRRHVWVWDDVANNTNDTSLPTSPPLLAVSHTYDEISNRLTAYDDRPKPTQVHRDWQYSYDGLDRLDEALRGAWNGSTFTKVDLSSLPTGFGSDRITPSEGWGLDLLGNWDDLTKDQDGDGPDAGDLEQGRVHNSANEMTDLDPDASAPGTEYDFTYGDAGNMRERTGSGGKSAPDLRFTHDAWNRLVKVEREGAVSYVSIGEYRYNGLNWRVGKLADTDNDGAIDEQRLIYYTANWQIAEERVTDRSTWSWDPTTGIDRYVQYIWGPRYIDDLIARRVKDENDGDTGVYDEILYHLTDSMFSTRVVLDNAGEIMERVSYDPYGEARHHQPGDVDGDGDADSTDVTLIQDIIVVGMGISPCPIHDADYEVEADLDASGTIDIADLLIAMNTTAALANGDLSVTGNVIGWDGYVFNPELQHYIVRHRHYSPEWGRWLERDPLGYVDGVNCYEYVSSEPTSLRDSSGLVSCTSMNDSCPGEYPPEGYPPAAMPRVPDAVIAQKCGLKGIEEQFRGAMSHCRKLGIGRLPSVTIKCIPPTAGKSCGGGTHDYVGHNKITIEIVCWSAKTGQLCGCTALERSLKHEIEHLRQLCDYGGFGINPKRYDKQYNNSDHMICQELAAYCKGSNGRGCTRGRPKNIGVQATTKCLEACNSLERGQSCVDRCMEIYENCECGWYRPPGGGVWGPEPVGPAGPPRHMRYR